MKLWKKIVLIVSTLIVVISSMILPIFADSGTPTTGDLSNCEILTFSALNGAKIIYEETGFIYDMESSLITNELDRDSQATHLQMTASDMRNTSDEYPMTLEGDLTYFSDLTVHGESSGSVSGRAIRLVNVGFDYGFEEKLNPDVEFRLYNQIIPTYKDGAQYTPYIYFQPSQEFTDDVLLITYKIKYYKYTIDIENNDLIQSTETVEWTHRRNYKASSGARVYCNPFGYQAFQDSDIKRQMENIDYKYYERPWERELTQDLAVEEISVYIEPESQYLLPEYTITAFEEAKLDHRPNRALIRPNDFTTYWNTNIEPYCRMLQIQAVRFNGDFWEFVQTSISGFFDFELLPGVSVGAMFMVIVGLLFFIIILKVFAGG